MFILLYAMIAGSVVEITYNYFFFIALMTIFAAADAKAGDGRIEESQQSAHRGNEPQVRR